MITTTITTTIHHQVGQVVTTQAGVGLVTGGSKSPLYNRINAVLSRTSGKNGLTPRRKVIMNRFKEAEALENLEEEMVVVTRLKPRPIWAGAEAWG